MTWFSAKHSRNSVSGRQLGLLRFFRWLQEHAPAADRLDAVSRPMVLAYAAHLREERDAGRISQSYQADLLHKVRLFFDFAIDERYDAAPTRNPVSVKDAPRDPEMLPRYLSDHEVQRVLGYCERDATLKERTVVMTLLHTGIRAAELAALEARDIVQVQGAWKLHIREGKGLKDRMIPLTGQALAALRAWEAEGWERLGPRLFSYHGRPWESCHPICAVVREMGKKLGLTDLTPHRFRHTFAVVLLNYGIRESALQKLLGHASLNMTLEYGRILDRTVEAAFSDAVERMREGPLNWLPNFFVQDDFTAFAEGDAVGYIRLPHGYCRRNPKLHCESDVKCLLCERYCAGKGDLPVLRQMHERFERLDLRLKALAVGEVIDKVERQPGHGLIPVNTITRSEPRAGGEAANAARR